MTPDGFVVLLAMMAFLPAMAGYLLGSIPFGLILTRMAGLGDIRAVGSGNIGATNVLRTGRRGLAGGTLLLDAAKAALAVALFTSVLGWPPRNVLTAIAAVFAVVGHCFPIWLRFKGGKGVATGLGALLVLDWRLGLAGCAVWLAVFLSTSISSVSALSAFAVMPLLGAFVFPDSPIVASILIALLVWIRHAKNIGRLLAGTEPRSGRRA